MKQFLSLKSLLWIFLVFSLLVLQGCERRYHIKANYLGGYLHTPWGKFKFKSVESALQASEMKLYDAPVLWRGYLYADAGDVIVVLSLNGQYTSFLADNNSKYGGKNYNITIKREETMQTIENNEVVNYFINFDLLNTRLSTMGFDEYSGVGVRKLPGGGLNPYQIYVPFIMSGDNFLVDVKVKASKVRYWDIDIGAPGMP